MTEDQKAISLILELLHAAKGVPVPRTRLEADAKYCGYRMEIATILEIMEEKKLITRETDTIGIRRYTITTAGKDMLHAL